MLAPVHAFAKGFGDRHNRHGVSEFLELVGNSADHAGGMAHTRVINDKNVLH